MAEQKWRGPYLLVESRDIYDNKWLHLREDRVVRPGGTEGLFGVIEMKAGSSVLALNENKEVYLVKEFKYGIGRASIELMSGGLEGSEQPLEAAKRELKEELGLEAAEWVDLGVVDPFTTVVHSPNFMFLALKVTEGAKCPDEGETLKTFRVPFSTAIEMVMRSEITHSASCVLILKADRYLRNHESLKYG